MPVPAALKATALQWHPDGRLVIVGDFVRTPDVYPDDADYADLLVTWRPGDAQLAIKPLGGLPASRGTVVVP